MKKPIIAGLMALTALALTTSCKEQMKTEFTTDKVERGNIQNSITATGTIEPVSYRSFMSTTTPK